MFNKNLLWLVVCLLRSGANTDGNRAALVFGQLEFNITSGLKLLKHGMPVEWGFSCHFE